MSSENNTQPASASWKIRCVFFLLSAGSIWSVFYLGSRISHMAERSALLGQAQWVATIAAAVLALGFLLLGVNWQLDDSRKDILKNRRLWRICLFLLFISLCVTWALPTGKPSTIFRAAVMVVFALGVMAFSLPLVACRVKALLDSQAGRILDILAVNILLIFILLEVGLRIAAIFVSSPLLSQVDVAAVKRIADQRLAPGGMRNGFPINSKGYYDSEWTVAKPAGTVRILGVGDSFLVGMVPYPNGVTVKLEEELSSRIGKSVEVVNVALEGLGPHEYLHQIESYAKLYDSDMVLLCLFVGNDLVSPKSRQGVGFARAVLTAETFYLPLLAKRIWRVAQERRRTGRDTSAALEARQLDDSGNVQGEDTPTFSEEYFMKLERHRLAFCHRHPGEYIAGGYAETRRVLKEIAHTSPAPVFVAIFPDEYQVNDPLWQEITAGNEEKYDRYLPQKKIGEWCAELGLPCIDVLEPLRQAQQERPTYLPRDSHWNSYGNAVAAEVLAEKLAPLVGSQDTD